MISERYPTPFLWRLTHSVAALFLISSAATVVACPLCYEAARQLVTVGQQLDMADRAEIAVPVDEGSRFQVVDVIKGSDAVGAVIADAVTGLDAAPPAIHDSLLLLHDPVAHQWTSMGLMRAEYADWLRQLTATSLVKGERPRAAWPRAIVSSALSYAGWRKRVALVLPYLESPDALVAQIASGELARAPYAVLNVTRSRIDATTVEGWLSDPKLTGRHAVYTLLLGFVGGTAEAARLEQRMEAAWNGHDATDLAAMIGADLELRGPSRVAWVEAMYFADRSRTMPEIEAALLALGVQGDADGTVSRARVIEAYRVFIKQRPQMAGFVAQQLADWGYWDAAAEYATLLRAQVIKDQGSELAVASYLQQAAAAGVPLQ